MRSARTDLQLISHEKQGDLPVALSLGYDFCAEHEMGISGIRALLGARNNELGIERHRAAPARATAHLKTVTLPRTKTHPSCYVLEMTWRQMNAVDTAIWKKALRRPDAKWDKAGYTSSWDASSFRVCAIAPEVIDFLQDFEAALATGNAAVMPISVSPGNPFSRNSLGLVIIDRLSADIVDAMHARDVDQRLLQEQASKLGFVEVFRTKGLKVHACSPRRIDAETMGVQQTEYPMQFWINSWEDRLQTGWFTVEALQRKTLEIFPDHHLRGYWDVVYDEMRPAEESAEAPAL